MRKFDEKQVTLAIFVELDQNTRCLLVLLFIKISAEHSADGKTNPEMNINFDEKLQSPLISSNYTRQAFCGHIKMSKSIYESQNNPELRLILPDQGTFPGREIMKNDRGSNGKCSQRKIKRLPWRGDVETNTDCF